MIHDETCETVLEKQPLEHVWFLCVRGGSTFE